MGEKIKSKKLPVPGIPPPSLILTPPIILSHPFSWGGAFWGPADSKGSCSWRRGSLPANPSSSPPSLPAHFRNSGSWSLIQEKSWRTARRKFAPAVTPPLSPSSWNQPGWGGQGANLGGRLVTPVLGGRPRTPSRKSSVSLRLSKHPPKINGGGGSGLGNFLPG